MVAHRTIVCHHFLRGKYQPLLTATALVVLAHQDTEGKLSLEKNPPNEAPRFADAQFPPES